MTGKTDQGSDRDDPQKVLWDVIVVGTGMGGATLGYALAKCGRRVLFLEKGTWDLTRPEDAILDRRAEEAANLSSLGESDMLDVLARAGRSTDEIEDTSGRRPHRSIPFVGSGTGGSSALYGMALERFFPADFVPRQWHAQAGDSTLPDQWPITYEEMRKWYGAAEELYRVRGTLDPLRGDDSAPSLLRPPGLSDANAELFRFLENSGLHPYQLHMACEAIPGCDTCQGYLCGRSCKNDAGRICVLPALRQHQARLLSGCRVVRLEAGRTAVDRVICDWQGRQLALRGKLIVLAAGALATPALLLSSSSRDWPQGLANRSGLVGRNLMRHCFDMLLIRAKAGTPLHGKHKEIAFTDYYHSEGQKLGAVQSLGVLPPAEAFANGLGGISRAFRVLRPVVAPIWKRWQSRTLVLALILEDLPYRDNWVGPMNPSRGDARQRLRLHYRLGPSEQARLKLFRGKVIGALKPYKPLLVKGGAKTGVQHVCGTCRFGVDPASSVLDPTNRAHGLENLYVADGSFFPSSAGINPALTIAANALRVASHIDKERLG